MRRKSVIRCMVANRAAIGAAAPLEWLHPDLTVTEIDLSDAVDRGLTVTELASLAEPIAAAQETTAAFVGRALRGPLNEPVLVTRYADFQRRFGGTWTRSSLGPAVAQFFEHGGRRAWVVRVANKARGAMVCLPASGTALVLRALEPGSTERIRAAVDYDGIIDDEHFNLTLQRVSPDTGLVSDQEFYSRASIAESSDSCIVERLLASSLVRAESPFPTHRPECTALDSSLPYVVHAQDGSDGAALSDYDLVGSRRRGTGLFALEAVPDFDLLYLPALSREADPGATAILAADRYCRERSAMLIVDPDRDLETPDAAIDRIRSTGYASPNMLSYFPRARLRDDPTAGPVTIGGALAGLLCKLDRSAGCWRSAEPGRLRLKRRFLPALDVDDATAALLERAGLNVLHAGAAGAASLAGAVTLGRGGDSSRAYGSLPIRRLVLRLLADIETGTHWGVFDADRATLPRRLEAQVAAYLEGLH
ncbi:MAG: hypothetical protein KJO38_08505, partial [Gammaproteobacteria bacterium]|nr:hypothetical protein [Gammaproteobacteria bacterium]